MAYGCRLKLQTVLSVITATAVLHNIAVTMNEDIPPMEGNMEEMERLNYLIEMGNIPDNPINEGFAPICRNQIVNYFGNLNQ